MSRRLGIYSVWLYVLISIFRIVWGSLAMLVMVVVRVVLWEMSVLGVLINLLWIVELSFVEMLVLVGV